MKTFSIFIKYSFFISSTSKFICCVTADALVGIYYYNLKTLTMIRLISLLLFFDFSYKTLPSNIPILPTLRFLFHQSQFSTQNNLFCLYIFLFLCNGHMALYLLANYYCKIRLITVSQVLSINYFSPFHCICL